VIGSLLLAAALALAPALPESSIESIALATARLELLLPSRRRTAVESNVAAIAASGRLGARRAGTLDQVVRSIFVSYHRFVLEFLAQRSIDSQALDTRFRFHGMEILYEALARGRGAVVAAPHVGNWELCAIAVQRLGFRVHVVTGVQFHARVTHGVRLLKERERIRVSTPRDGFRPLLETLKGGGLVALLTDGDVFTRSLDTELFGCEVPLPVGPALLARRSGAPLVHAHAERTSCGTHVVSFDGVDVPDRALPLHEDVRRLTLRIARFEERTIASHLDQWCIFRPFFRNPDAA
jgi:lauroyl/myristoyl acyltransferase